MGKVRCDKRAVTLRRLFSGHPQRDYKRHRREIDYVFTHIFPRWMPTFSLTVPPQTCIAFQRLYDWKRQWTLDPNWRPYTYELRGLHHRTFSKAEEQVLADYITKNYILPGNLFTDDTFGRIAIHAYLEKHQEDENSRQFECSARFINCFKMRNGFSSRRAHLKRRPKVKQGERGVWITQLAQLLRDVPDHDQIINADESCWQVYPAALKTWAPISSQNIQSAVSGNGKDSFTVMAAITTAQTKLPLSIIAAGKTPVVEVSHFGDVAYDRTAHSESRWQMRETFIE